MEIPNIAIELSLPYCPIALLIKMKTKLPATNLAKDENPTLIISFKMLNLIMNDLNLKCNIDFPVEKKEL